MTRGIAGAFASPCRLAVTLIALAAGGLLSGHVAYAEPYLAVRTGLHCVNCHVNPTGGGQRNAFGNSYAQSVLAGRVVSATPTPEPWTGAINRWISVGGDFRARLAGFELPGDEDSPTEFEVQELLGYLQVNLIPERLSLHVDELLGPRGASNRQAYALLRPAEGAWYLKAGRFFLPFGLRLEDDAAFIRQMPGINFNTPDTGVELGMNSGSWSAQVALSNGSAGGPETDDGKQISLLASYATARWRAGLSLNHNDSDVGDRRMAGVFAGVSTGPIAWLAEVDLVRDDSLPGASRTLRAALLEANWELAQGHNLKLTHEQLDPDETASVRRRRSSLIWEYFPMQFIQSRIGLRSYDGTTGIALENRDEWFAQLHVYF